MNNRPYVNAKSNNILEELMTELGHHLPEFQSYEGIAGIMLDGGLSRGFGDNLSEIDVVIFLHSQEYAEYQNKLTPTGLGITKIGGYLYDIKLLDYEEELRKDYDNVGLWDLSYARILYDPSGELQALFDRKLAKEAELSQAQGYMFEAWWNYRLAGDIWIQRQDALQGHYTLNFAVRPLISALFIANKEYIPHDKWLIHMSRTLSWLPDHYEVKLKQMMSAGDLSMDSLVLRQQAIHELWQEIDARLCYLGEYHKDLNFMHSNLYDNLKSIYQRQNLSLSEWMEDHSVGELNYEPYRSVLKLEEGTIRFNRQRAERLSEDDLYNWFYEIVRAVIAEEEWTISEKLQY